MGKGSSVKQIRGQIRQVIKEILPELLTEQLVATIQKQLTEQLVARLNLIDDKQRDLQSYLVRNPWVPASPLNPPTINKASE